MHAPLSHARPKVSILHLEDSSIDADLVCEYLKSRGLECDIDRVWARDAFTRALREKQYDLILADHQLPAFDGEAALEIAVELAPQTPFIFVSGTLGEDVAVEAMRHGATDYVVKQRLSRLPSAVERALAEASERKGRAEAESALRDSEANFATLVDSMPLLCWMADAAGEANWFNRRWYDYTGTSAAEMRGGGWRGFHHPDQLAEVQRRWQASLATGEPFDMVFPLRGADGQYRQFLTRAVPVRDDAGAIVRWLGTSTDVSAQYEIEEQLKRLNETLEMRVVAAVAEREKALAHLSEMQKMETIGQLTGGVAHDFNNLLTPILGGLDLLRRRFDEDPRTQRTLAGATEAAERARTLVQRLLAFARRQVLEVRAVDVPRLVRNIEELIHRTIGPQIEIAIEAPAEPTLARVDASQLELAILNLAVNARDAMPEGGTLRLRVDMQEIGQGHPLSLRYGCYVRVSVSDTGTGMDEATLARAVEPFFSTKELGRGTGLGLSMVHGLAGQSGGTLRLHSVVGQGTTAEIWLPAATGADEEMREDPASDDRTVPALRVLLVDDEDLVRASTAEMLRDLGHQVIEARSGGDAIGMVRDGTKPDVVVTDFLMPGMNGVELIAKLRTELPGTPMILATGYAKLAGHEHVDVPLLPKPYRRHELASRLADAAAVK